MPLVYNAWTINSSTKDIHTVCVKYGSRTQNRSRCGFSASFMHTSDNIESICFRFCPQNENPVIGVWYGEYGIPCGPFRSYCSAITEPVITIIRNTLDSRLSIWFALDFAPWNRRQWMLERYVRSGVGAIWHLTCEKGQYALVYVNYAGLRMAF